MIHTSPSALPLTLVPNPILSTLSTEMEIDEIISPATQDLIDQMFVTMKVEHGCGLAAPQIGKNIKLAVIDAEHRQFTIINPVITRKSDERVFFTEGCLSIPGKEFPIIRYDRITVEYLDRDAKQCKIKLKDFLAIVFQHEIDHLNGTVIQDRHTEQKDLRKRLENY